MSGEVSTDSSQRGNAPDRLAGSSEKVLMKGNEAIGEGAIRAGCQAYFGYPITPQSEILEYMARRMPELGRVFLQAESELAAINMVYGAKGRERNVVKTLYLRSEPLEALNRQMGQKLRAIAANEVRYSETSLDEADVAVVAYGTCSRVAHTAVKMARSQGVRAGLFRPISLFPFPTAALRKVSERVKGVLVVEMSLGQMVEDVMMATRERVPVEVCNRLGGAVPEPQGVLEAIKSLQKR